MKGLVLVLLSVFVSLDPAAARAQAAQRPPLAEYMMAPQAEVALARSGAPERVSARATVEILRPSGFKIAAEGDNGFVCMVLRGWSAAPDRELVYYAKLRAPICCRPHMMVYAPYYENSMLGGHEMGGPLPIAAEGGPFTVVVIPVDDELAVKSAGTREGP